MEMLLTYFQGLGRFEIFVLTCIILFISTIILFITLTLVSRGKKIRREIFRKKNTKNVEKFLFSIAFDGNTFASLERHPDFSKNWKRKIFKEQFLTELIKLHQLYAGEIGNNLQKCYASSGLMQLSFAKIRSRKWHIKCAGIQELSEMEIKKAIPIILEHTKSKNDTLKMVALIEVIHLKGLAGLSILENYEESLNDWIQLNLIESIKEASINDVPDFGYLLESSNKSIVIFGLRLITLFHQNQHISTVNSLQQTSSRKINLQATTTYKHLTETSNDTAVKQDKSVLQVPLVKTTEKESYNKSVLKIVIISILFILTVVLSYLFF